MNKKQGKEMFKMWLATPRNERDQPTQAEFAETIGRHPTTLSRWKAEPNFIAEISGEVKRRLTGRLADVLEAQIAAAIEDRSTPAATLVMKYLGVTQQASPIIIEGTLQTALDKIYGEQPEVIEGTINEQS